jgi:hypothetical protein
MEQNTEKWKQLDEYYKKNFRSSQNSDLYMMLLFSSIIL